MIPGLELLWDTITIPLSWMPPFCLRLLETIFFSLLVFVVVSLVVKLASLIRG